MATKNIFGEKMDAVKKWWDSDTTKAISTIIAVLLIPAAVLAWNYASGRNVNVEDSILEGDSTSTEENVVTEESADTTNETATEKNTTEKDVVKEDVVTSEEEKTDLEIGGITQVTTLPNTSAIFE